MINLINIYIIKQNLLLDNSNKLEIHLLPVNFIRILNLNQKLCSHKDFTN